MMRAERREAIILLWGSGNADWRCLDIEMPIQDAGRVVDSKHGGSGATIRQDSVSFVYDP